LRKLSTVGQILDFLGFSIKMLFVETTTTTSHVRLLNEIFEIMPVAWEMDPVKVRRLRSIASPLHAHCVICHNNPICLTVLQVHLVTKIIYETLNADFNNTMHVINKIICDNNRFGFYVALTLFWALFLNYFKEESPVCFRMYDVDEFFKLLTSQEPLSEKQDANSVFQLLMLISIYQNYVLFNKVSADSHQVFQEFFKVSSGDRDRLNDWLITVKTVIEVSNPIGKSNESSDVLTVSSLSSYD